MADRTIIPGSPATPAAWVSYVRASPSTRNWEGDPDIYKLVNTNSASKVEKDQFMCLRILWKMHHYKRANYSRFFKNMDEYNEARHLLADSQPFEAYLQHIGRHDGNFDQRHTIPSNMNQFSSPRLNQLEVNRTDVKDFEDGQLKIYRPPATRSMVRADQGSLTLEERGSPKPKKGPLTAISRELMVVQSSPYEPESFVSGFQGSPLTPATSVQLHPTSKDESIVNTSLIVFVQSFTLYHSEALQAFWTSQRMAYKVGSKDHTCFIARCDGALIGAQSGDTKVLLETKPVIRHARTRVAICMQESAQMAALIATESAQDPGPHVDQDPQYRFVNCPIEAEQVVLTLLAAA